MGVPRLLTAIVVLGACSIALGQEPVVSPFATAPAARLAPVTGSPSAAEVPPLLPIPAPQPVSQPPCRSCPNDYHSSHVFLPDQNPDCRSGGCDGDCHDCRRIWIEPAFFIGKAENLPTVDRQYLLGFQFDGGYWFSDQRTVGLDVSFFDLYGSWHHEDLVPSVIDSPVSLVTFDANLRFELFNQERVRVDGLLGYRYTQLHEQYLVATTTVFADLANRNQIHAGQIGFVADYRYGPYFAEMVGKLAVGRSNEDIDVGAARTVEHDVCLIPEFGLRIGYQFGESLWGTLGYRFTYLSNVDRPGQHDTTYFLHGLTIGFEKRF
jgi:hypothetical protein